MQKILLAVVVLAVVIVGWIFFKNKKGDIVVSPTQTSESTPTLSVGAPTSDVRAESPSPVVLNNVVVYTDSGYTPNTITIKKGEIIAWKNESKLPMWTASAVHPTHKAYPGSGIELCGTKNPSVAIFDACKGYDSGQSWSFKFDNIGTWKYHNHSNSSHFGTIVVE